MLITLSGHVGSGKSSTARHIAERLAQAGVTCQSVRFRASGPVFSRATGPEVASRRPRPEEHNGVRWRGFRRRRLSVVRAGVYIARIATFRLTGARRIQGWCVFDRYFYDSFAHYELRSLRERCYVALIAWLMPVPDLAILLTASPEIIAERRPNYAPEYIRAADAGYRALPARFPEMVEICTDPGEPALERLEALLQERVLGVPAERHGRRAGELSTR